MKKRVTSYTFNAAAKTITSTDFTSLDAILLITNVTDNVIIYNFANPALGATLAGTTLTLVYDTTSMSNGDNLQIFIDDGATTQAVSAASLPLPSGAATSAKQDTGNTSLASLETKIGEVQASPTSNTLLDRLKQIYTALTGTLTVGTHAVTQSGTWTVQPGNTANTTAWKVDGSAVTQPVSGTFWQATQPVSLASVPTHAVTQSGTWTVTANAGTNLNTSALALETGGNLASVATNTTNIPNVVGTAASAIPSKLLQVGGSDGTNARAIKVNTSGQLDVRPLTSSDTVTVAQSTATSLKTQAENYQGGTAVSSSNPLQVTLANTGANATAVKVDGSAVTQPISQAAPTTVYNGKKTVTTAGTRVTLASSTTVKSVTIKALDTNTGYIYVGDTTVASTNGFQLAAGETVSLDLANLSTVNLDSSVSGEGVTYIGVN